MACFSSEKQVLNSNEDDDDNEKYLVVAQKLFAIPWKEVAIIVIKNEKKRLIGTR